MSIGLILIYPWVQYKIQSMDIFQSGRDNGSISILTTQFIRICGSLSTLNKVTIQQETIQIYISMGLFQPNSTLMVEERLGLFSQILHFFWVWIWIWIIRFMAVFNTVNLLVTTFATFSRKYSLPWPFWIRSPTGSAFWFEVIFTPHLLHTLPYAGHFSLSCDLPQNLQSG